MRELPCPCDDGRVDAVVDCKVTDPLIGVGLAHRDQAHPVAGMGLQHVTHPIRHQVSGAEHTRPLGQVVIPDAMLQHQSQQHILDCLHRLANLVQHHDDGFAGVHLEAGVGGKLGDFDNTCWQIRSFDRLGVGQREVTQVQQGAVDVRGLVVGVGVAQYLQHGRLADAGFALPDQGDVGADLANGQCELFERDGTAKVDD